MKLVVAQCVGLSGARQALRESVDDYYVRHRNFKNSDAS
jgi:hypothetical protein